MKNTYSNFGGPDAEDKVDGEAEMPNSSSATLAPLTLTTDEYWMTVDLDEFWSEWNWDVDNSFATLVLLTRASDKYGMTGDFDEIFSL